VPNFLRYQLRSKFAELRTNVEAIRKSENGLRQSERRLCSTSTNTGFYVGVGTTPSTGTIGPSKLPWVPADYALARAIDWEVEGNTYGKYSVLVTAAAGVTACAAPAGIGTFGNDMTVQAHADIDGDGTQGLVASFRPIRNAAGAVTTAAPTITLAGDLSNCAGGTQPASVADGEVFTCSGDSIF
jgi:type IV pilus assembly protein PilA